MSVYPQFQSQSQHSNFKDINLKRVNFTNNKGFTLLELMVAMMIFAMLALLGWQVFSGLNQANERASSHADTLADLQYAYLQIQNDINQIVAWQVVTGQQPVQPVPTQQANQASQRSQNNQQQANLSQDAMNARLNFFQLSTDSVAFIRFADPDPRYQTSPTLIRVEYLLQSNSLIRRQSAVINENNNKTSAETGMELTLLSDVDNLQLQALLPKPSAQFSSRDNQNNSNHPSYSRQSQSQNQSANQAQNQAQNPPELAPALLPKGLSISFNYQKNPINWRFALPKSAPMLSRLSSHVSE